MKVTDEMWQAVQPEQCSMQGHSFAEITTYANGDPVVIVCDQCGRSWDVVR